MYADATKEESGFNAERALRLIEQLEHNLRDLKQMLGVPGGYDSGESTYFNATQSGEAEAIEGVFDGEHMVDFNGKVYQVSANYASKSKLIEGDPLKLYITPEGKFFYKQLGPVARKTVPGVLRAEGNRYVVEAEDGRTYNILTASVTYYMSLFNLRPGDKVLLMLPAEGDAQWAVIDNIL